MRGIVFSVVAFGALGLLPDAVSAREIDQIENANCSCKTRRPIVLPLSESAPIRKKDKDRVRRILM